VAYRAEIEIGVKGAQKLQELQRNIGKVSKEIDLLGARDLFENKTLQNIQSYNKTLKDAADNLKVVSFASEKAAKATATETAAIKTYVSALLSAEGAQSRQNRLIDEEIAKRRVATQELKAYNAAAAAPTQRGAATTMSGGYLRGSYTGGSQGRLSQRAKGLNQYERPVFPQPDINREIARRSKLRSIARATAKIEQQRSKRLAGQNSLTSGLLRLNNAVLNAARSEAQARGESVAKQRELNRQLAKSQQYSRPIGPQPQRAAPTRRRSTAFFGGEKNVLKLGAAYLSLNTAVRQVGRSIDAATQAASGEQRIKALSAGFDDYREVLAATERAQEKFNLGTIESQDAFAQLFGRLRPAGFALSEVETIFNGFNTAAALTGATARESAGALLQLTQALGAGFLSGQEFNSVAEQAPAVLQAIAKEVDRPVGQLKQLAKDGKLTSEVLLNALKRVETEGADRLAEALDTPAQKLKNLQNNVEDLNIELGKLVLPAVEEGLEGVSGAAEKAAEEVIKTQQAAKTLNEQMGKLDGFFKAIDANPVIKWLGDIGKAAANSALLLIPFANQIKALVQLRDILAGQRPKFEDDGFIGPQVPENLKPLKDRLGLGDPDKEDPDLAAKKIKQLADAAKRLKDAQTEARNETDLVAFDKKIQDAIRVGDRVNQTILEGERRILGIRQETGRALEGVTDKKLEQAVLDKAIAQFARVQMETQTKLLQLDKDRTGELEKQASLAVKIVSDAAGISQDALGGRQQELKQVENRIESGDKEAAFAARVKDLVRNKGVDFQTAFDIQSKLQKANEELVKMQTNVDPIQQIGEQIGDQLNTGITGALVGAVQGTKNLGEAFQDLASDIFAAIGQALILKAVTSAVGAPGVGGKAGTGLLGSIFRADGGPVSANQPSIVGERGPELFIPFQSGRVVSNEMSRASSSNEMSRASSSKIPFTRNIESATQAQETAAVMQNAGPIDVRYESQVINNVEYVTAEQHRQGMTQAAERGRAMTLTTLQNSPRTRSKVGI